MKRGIPWNPLMTTSKIAKRPLTGVVFVLIFILYNEAKSSRMTMYSVVFMLALFFSQFAHAAGPEAYIVQCPEVPGIYYYGEDGKRYAFPSTETFWNWYPDFQNVQEIPCENLAEVPFGGFIVYKDGVRLVRIGEEANWQERIWNLPEPATMTSEAVDMDGIVRLLKDDLDGIEEYSDNVEAEMAFQNFSVSKAKEFLGSVRALVNLVKNTTFIDEPVVEEPEEDIIDVILDEIIPIDVILEDVIAEIPVLEDVLSPVMEILEDNVPEEEVVSDEVILEDPIADEATTGEQVVSEPATDSVIEEEVPAEETGLENAEVQTEETSAAPVIEAAPVLETEAETETEVQTIQEEVVQEVLPVVSEEEHVNEEETSVTE